MRVTFVIPEASMAGGVRVVATHAAHLLERGHSVVVVSIPPRRPTARERFRALVRRREWIATPDPSSHLDGIGVEHRVLETRRAVTDADVPDADVIIATWWETAEWVGALSPEKGAKVYFVQGDETAYYPESDATTRGRVLATLRLPMRRITVSEWVKQQYARRGVFDFAVVPNAVDHELFRMHSRGKRENPTVGFVYAPPSLKGVDVATEAVARARQTLPDLRVVVFGSERPGPRVLPEGAKFVHRPAQREIPALYAQTDAWLFPSRSEGFGLPVIEAMATGTPVIGSPMGIAPEVLGEGGGVLLGGPDPAEMTAAIVRVGKLSDEAWRRLSAEAHGLAKRYTWDTSVARFEAELIRAAQIGARGAVAV